MRAGADVVQHIFEGYAQQKNWALENVPFRGEWVLILNADERVPPELAAEIKGVVAADGNGYNGFYLNRKLIFYGKWIRHCGWYPSWNLRLFRRGQGRYEQREVHEHLLLVGKAGYCQHDLIHEDWREMSFWIAKHNRYSSQEARELDRVRRGVSTAGLQTFLLQGQLGAQAFYQRRGAGPHLPGRAFLSFLYWYFVPSWFFRRQARGFLFCQMHAIFEQFTTGEALGIRALQAGCARRSAINAPKVFRSPVRVDTERSKK